MNIKKTFIACAAATLLAGSFAQAANIDITGSSAFRALVTRAILDKMTGATMAWSATSGSATLSNADQQIFVGTIDGTAYTIRTSWNGSVEGVLAITNPTIGAATQFVPTTAPRTAGAGTKWTGAMDTGLPTIAFSDVYQNSTPVSQPTLTDEIVGVVPFVWVANNGATFNNITTQLANYLLSAGKVDMYQFTGLSGDAGKRVFATGRYNGSGTRASALAEIAYGVFNTVNQYNVTLNGSSQIATLGLWPDTSVANLTNQINDGTVGNGGYNSGGNIRDFIGKAMATSVTIKDETGGVTETLPAASVAVVGYLGIADANNSAASGKVLLNYNGVPYSAANVQNGLYTFWGYEHVLYNTLTTEATAVKNAIIAAIPTAIGELESASAGSSPGLPNDSTMKVSRNNDGGPVSP